MKVKKCDLSVAGIHGLSDMKIEVVTANVGPSETETIGDTLTFCSLPNLNAGDKKYDFETLKQEYDYPSNLPDIENSMKDLKVILGQAAYHLIWPLDDKSGEKSQPWAVKTALGWTVSGALPKNETSRLSVSCNLSNLHINYQSKWRNGGIWRHILLFAMLQENWQKKNKRFLFWKRRQNTMANVMKFDFYGQKRSQVCQTNTFLHSSSSFRWKNGLRMMFNWKLLNRETIEKDLKSYFVRRFDDKEASETENAMQWYLPNHPVKHPHQQGKIRRVCNNASKFKGISLNDKLLSGPDLLRNLYGIVFRGLENTK